MISIERFDEGIRKIIACTGSMLRKEAIPNMWDKMKEYDVRDFDTAVESLCFYDDRFNLKVLAEVINQKRRERVGVMFEDYEDYVPREECNFRTECLKVPYPPYPCRECHIRLCLVWKKELPLLIRAIIDKKPFSEEEFDKKYTNVISKGRELAKE